MTLGTPTPERSLRAPRCLPPPEFPAACPPPEFPPPPVLVPNPGKHAPFPPIPRVRAAHPRAVPTSSGPAVRSPPGRERADANSAPAPRPPPRAGFRLHARLPRAGLGCASRFAPQPPGAPQPRVPGEEGRAPGAGLVCANPAGPRPPPPFSASPWPLRLPPKPLLAPAVVFSPVRSGDGSARSFCTQLERSFWLSTRWGNAG